MVYRYFLTTLIFTNMASLPRITEDSLVTMASHPSKPIAFIQVINSEDILTDLVIKREAQSDRSNPAHVGSIAWTSKIMKNVQDPLVKMILLDDQELNFLTSVVNQYIPGTPTCQDLIENVENSVWVKMLTASDLSDGAFSTRGGDGKKDELNFEKLTALLSHLHNPDNWVELGKVLAADIFNGNSDRFSLDGTSWTNGGNLLFINARIIGLDVWDPSNRSGQSNLFDRQMGRNHTFESKMLDPLSDTLKRRQYAENVVKAVGERIDRTLKNAGYKEDQKISITFGKGRGKVKIKCKRSEFTDLYTHRASLVEQGVIEGTDKLREYLLVKINRYAQENARRAEQFAQEARQNFAYNHHNGDRRGNFLANVRPQASRNAIPKNVSNHNRRMAGTFDPIQSHLQHQQPSPPPQLIAQQPQQPILPADLRKAVPNGIIQRMVYLKWIPKDAIPYL